MDNLTEGFYFKGTNNFGVLLCHGFTGAPGEMKELGVALNKEGYTVKCIEYRGHGSDKENFLNTNVYEWYNDLQSALEELRNDVKFLYVMGLSMGGAFSVKVAEDYNIQGLVTMNAPLVGMPLKEILDSRKEDLTDDVYQLELNSLTKYSKFITEVGQTINLNKITAPLLIVQGMIDQDRYKISSHMLTTYSNSKILKRIDLPKSGHLVTTEDERYDLFKAIIMFLKEIEKKS